jgi:hypothetical protein
MQDHVVGMIQVLQEVLRIDSCAAAVREGEGLTQIQAQVGGWIDVDIDPPLSKVASATKVQLEPTAFAEGSGLPQSGPVPRQQHEFPIQHVQLEQNALEATTTAKTKRETCGSVHLYPLDSPAAVTSVPCREIVTKACESPVPDL